MLQYWDHRNMMDWVSQNLFWEAKLLRYFMRCRIFPCYCVKCIPQISYHFAGQGADASDWHREVDIGALCNSTYLTLPYDMMARRPRDKPPAKMTRERRYEWPCWWRCLITVCNQLLSIVQRHFDPHETKWRRTPFMPTLEVARRVICLGPPCTVVTVASLLLRYAKPLSRFFAQVIYSFWGCLHL